MSFSVDFSKVIVSERDAVWTLQGHISELHGFAENFHSCHALAGALERSIGRSSDRIASLTTFIPFRDGAMNLFHFLRTMEMRIPKAMSKCPEFRELVDHGQLREARKQLRADFPGLEKLRDSVAHQGELDIEVDGLVGAAKVGKVYSMENEDGRSLLANVVNGREYTNSWKGKLYSYSLDEKSVATLYEISAAHMAAVPRRF